MANQVQPIFIIPEGASRNSGKSAQKANIAAAKAVADAVRSTLGPRGMDKMLVDGMGDIVITNDGVTILDEMEIEHPAAKMMVEVAKVQEKEVGDGTTTAVILGGELLKNAEQLIDKNIHPTVIAKGYQLAAEKAKAILGKLGEPVTLKDKDILQKVARTAMVGKNVEMALDKLADMAVEAVMSVAEAVSGKIVVDLDDIKIEKKEGGGTEDSELIRGIVIDKEKVHSDMPRSVAKAKIALLDVALELKSTETDSKIRITDPKQLQAFLDQEEAILKKMVDKVRASGATAIFCQKGIDDLVQHYLAKEGIYAARRVKKSDIEALAKATGAKLVSNIDDLKKTDLGFAGLVEEQKIAGEDMTFVKECKNPKAVSILVRGGTEHVVTEVERALTDAVGDLSAALTVGKCVAGGGAVDVELAKQLRAYADTLSGREQLAVQAFAEALEVVPRTLAENAGIDPIDCLTTLKARHDAGEKWCGLDLLGKGVSDTWKAGVIEPLKIKTQAVQSAAEAAIMLLRIDDIVTASKLGKDAPATGAPQMEY